MNAQLAAQREMLAGRAIHLRRGRLGRACLAEVRTRTALVPVLVLVRFVLVLHRAQALPRRVQRGRAWCRAVCLFQATNLRGVLLVDRRWSEVPVHPLEEVRSWESAGHLARHPADRVVHRPRFLPGHRGSPGETRLAVHSWNARAPCDESLGS